MRHRPVKAVGRCQCCHEPALGHARSLSEHGPGVLLHAWFCRFRHWPVCMDAGQPYDRKAGLTVRCHDGSLILRCRRRLKTSAARGRGRYGLARFLIWDKWAIDLPQEQQRGVFGAVQRSRDRQQRVFQTITWVAASRYHGHMGQQNSHIDCKP